MLRFVLGPQNEMRREEESYKMHPLVKVSFPPPK